MLLQSMVLSRDTDKVAVLMRAFSRLDIDVVLNVSEGGIAVRLSEAAKVCQAVRARFNLPGIREAIDVQGQIAWADKHGRAGIRFMRVSSQLQSQLKQWLFPALREGKVER